MMIKLKYILGITLPFFLLLNCFGQKPSRATLEGSVETVDHTPWDILLKKHVDEKGNVDYKGFVADRDQLRSYLEYLSQNPIANSAPKEEQLAYYINLYNAGTVQLIVDNYPLESIKDIFRPWGKDRLKIGVDSFSLGEIEHDILRKMDEPRIHFAINCASYSCPKLLNSAYSANELEEQLKKATFDFINDPTKNKISQNTVALSKIFKWYGDDFTTKSPLIDYLNKYVDIEISQNAEIDYLTYDWSLNEKR
ncbi:DUF547 domain-containing protein [Maribacter polysiphoniae]|uniref:DUF547 domain-containing protein n=2 Tax=Maribacter polysiphoniae TaxID=429344 RepID=A0ABR7VX14_9FLAO|nr:DUF547 domain-containing protein [Maribacter polysiphoniae]MBD1260506.1 DUF547 domain-containing protein [Maribacter polysiphoniae]